MNHYDLIASKRVPPKDPFTDEVISMADQFVITVGPGHAAPVRNVIERMTPGYLGAFDSVMAERWLSFGNMFVARRPAFKEYSGWLFPIRSESEQVIPYRGFADHRMRVFGFLGERLMNVWALQNRGRLKIGHLTVGMVSD